MEHIVHHKAKNIKIMHEPDLMLNQGHWYLLLN